MEFILALLNPQLDEDFKELLQCESGDKEQYVALLREAAEKLEYPEVNGKELLDLMNDRASSAPAALSPVAKPSDSTTAAASNTFKNPAVSGRNLNGSSTTASASSDSFLRSPSTAAQPQSPVRAGPVVDPIESRHYVLLSYDRKEETKLYVPFE
jgi:hypothetical protein